MSADISFLIPHVDNSLLFLIGTKMLFYPLCPSLLIHVCKLFTFNAVTGMLGFKSVLFFCFFLLFLFDLCCLLWFT